MERKMRSAANPALRLPGGFYMTAKNFGRTTRKILFSAALAAFVFGATVPVYSRAHAAQNSAKQAQDSKTASGKVSSIGQDKKSIELETTDNGNKNTMTFMIDDNTHVTGRVAVGTDATVEYQPTQDGKLLALTISPNTESQ
jgi:Cu/Ag efflux protein CusF